MNRNLESHFSEVPYIDKPRSIFDRSHGVKTSGNIGDLIPIDWQPVLPGDTWRQTSSKVIRLQTMLTPIMDNMYVDFYTFFVPYRLVFSKTREFFGENTTSAWVQQTVYRIPAISAPNGGFNTGTIADYLGLPVGVDWSNQDRNAPMALPFRAYALICNEFFRDQNLSDPLNIPVGDSDQTGTNGTSYINDVANGGAPFKVAKYHDRFTSCLPSPQKAMAPVSVPGYNAPFAAPVYSTVNTHGVGYSANDLVIPNTDGIQADFLHITGISGPEHLYSYPSSNTGNLLYGSDTVSAAGKVTPQANGLIPDNLWARIPEIQTSFTVNELRLAFQMQRYYEQLARGGEHFEFIGRLRVKKIEEKNWKAA